MSPLGKIEPLPPARVLTRDFTRLYVLGNTMHDIRPSPMAKRRRPGLWLTARLALAVPPFLSLPAWAALGDTVASVSTDSVRLKATMRVATHASYSVDQLQTGEGITIREFVSAGVVFAVTWQGPYRPDPRQLFGRYFDIYLNAPRTTDSSRTRSRIEQPELVVHSSGHMRAFAGLAYLPNLLPAGVNAGDLQ